MHDHELELHISKRNDAIVKNNKKCIKCGYCKKICKNDVTVAKMTELTQNKEPICINCGQCTNICPTESIHERFHYRKVKNLLHNKNDKIITFSIDPAVCISLGEEFNLSPGTDIEAQIIAALKKIGVDYVFNMACGKDLTIIEEATKLVNHLKSKKSIPHFTSSCPAWIKYCEIFYPKVLPYISTTKGPMAIQSTIIKTYFSNKIHTPPEKIINIIVSSCTAQKSAINRQELNFTNKDTNYALTTRELALLLKEEGINLEKAKLSAFDSPLSIASGAGIIASTSGGFTEAVIRTAYYFLTNKNLSQEKLNFVEVRGMNGLKEVEININDRVIKFATCNGIKNFKNLIDKLTVKELAYDFIEVMNCQGGCIAGGGAPKITLLEMATTKNARMNALYQKDQEMTLRLSHENQDIISIYNEFFKKNNSKFIKNILNTKYINKSYMLGDDVNGKTKKS